MRYLLISSFILSVFNCFAQLDTAHWIPPLHAGLNGQIADHYVYLSTPEIVPFTVTISDGSGVILASPTISNNTPFAFFAGNGQTSGSPLFVNRASLNTVLTNRGLKLVASENFYASVRVRSNNQADWAVSKGMAGVGTEFRFGGFPQFNVGPGGNPSNRNFVMGIMATQNNTSITVSDYNPAVTLDGVPVFLAPPTFTITLNQGETYVVAGGTDFAPNQNGFIGALIQADKPIALNNGNMNGTIHPTNTMNQDMGIDLSIPVERLGKEYIFVEGNGNPIMEQPIIIAHQDSTKIFVNGSSTPIATINAGNFFLIPNTNYQGTNHRNMFVKTSKPVYAYQALAATSSADNDGGLVLVPPFSCFLPDSIDLIPLIDSIGATKYQSSLLITTEFGTTVQVNGIPLANPEPVLGTNWQTYKTDTLSGNIKITSTGGVTASVLGVASPAGYAGYFSGFSSIPLASDFIFSDTCFSSVTSFNAIFDIQFTLDSIGWNFGDPASGNNNFSNINNPTHIFTAPSTYTVQMVVYRCKNDTVTKQITILPTATFTQNPVICQGQTFMLPSGAIVTSTGVFIDTLQNAGSNGCDSIVTTNLTVNPAVSFVQNFNECQGFSVTVGSNVYNTSGNFVDTLTTVSGCDSVVTTNLTITTPNSTTNIFNECQGFSVIVGSNVYNTSGIFIDINGCDTIITDLTINSIPTFTLIKADDNCGEEIGEVAAIANTVNPPITYNWNIGTTDSIISNLPVGTYTITVTDANGCINIDSIQIVDLKIDCEPFVFIPNVFTPNGDGQNELFNVKLKGLEFINLEIYNRWGLNLFKTSNENQGWDGKTKSGQEAKDGTYFFILNYKENNIAKKEKGTLMLFR